MEKRERARIRKCLFLENGEVLPHAGQRWRLQDRQAGGRAGLSAPQAPGPGSTLRTFKTRNSPRKRLRGLYLLLARSEPPAWSRWHSKGHGRHAGTVSFASKPWAHLLPSICTAWPWACGGSRGATRTPGTACGRTASTCGREGKLTSHPGQPRGTCPRRAEGPSPRPSLRPPSLGWGSLSEGCLPWVPPTQPSQGHHGISRLPHCLELQAQMLSGSQQVIYGRSLPDGHRGSCSQGTLDLWDAPLAVQHVRDAGLGDDGVITFEPLVLVLSDEAGVVAALQGPLVVDHRKQRVPDGMAAGTQRSLNPVTTQAHSPHREQPKNEC